MHRLAAFFIIFVMVLLGGCARPAPESSMEQGTRIEPPAQLSDFTLPSSLGRNLSLSELRGKPVVLFFGYTFCPDVCPMTLSELKRVKAELGADGERLQVVFVSVDGERDTPEVLARHLAASILISSASRAMTPPCGASARSTGCTTSATRRKAPVRPTWWITARRPI